MKVITIIKNTALIAASILVSLNVYAANDPESLIGEFSETMRSASEFNDNLLEQLRCISGANYQASYYNLEPEALAALYDDCKPKD